MTQTHIGTIILLREEAHRCTPGSELRVSYRVLIRDIDEREATDEEQEKESGFSQIARDTCNETLPQDADLIEN